MKFKTQKPVADVPLDDGANVKKSAMTVYGSQAVETDPTAVVRQVGEIVRAYVTLHPKPGSRFLVARGYPGGCVTVGTIRRAAAVHNISIASESCEGAAHQEALAALFNPSS